MNESASLGESESLGIHLPTTDEIRWVCVTDLECRDGLTGEVVRTERIEGNLLVYGGASALWDTLIGAGTVDVFDDTNARIGVGDSATAAAADQTDLQASSNKLRKGMDATYPTHTDGVVIGSKTILFRSTFTTSEANFAWNEWGLFNHASAGRMLNRKVAALGTKTSAQEWSLSVSLSLA